MDRNDWQARGVQVKVQEEVGGAAGWGTVHFLGSGRGWRRFVLCIVEGGIGLPVSVSSFPLITSCRV